MTPSALPAGMLFRPGASPAHQRNLVLIGATGTGKPHLAIAIARALIRGGTRGRFFNAVDLVNRLETETAAASRAAWSTASRSWTG